MPPSLLIISMAAGAVGAAAARPTLALPVVLGHRSSCIHHRDVAFVGLDDVGRVALLHALSLVNAVAASARARHVEIDEVEKKTGKCVI